MDTLTKYQEEALEIKNTETKMNSIFDKLISQLDMAQERSSDLEGMSIETSQLKTNNNNNTLIIIIKKP